MSKIKVHFLVLLFNCDRRGTMVVECWLKNIEYYQSLKLKMYVLTKKKTKKQEDKSFEYIINYFCYVPFFFFIFFNKNKTRENGCFFVSLMLLLVLTVECWLFINIFQTPMLFCFVNLFSVWIISFLGNIDDKLENRIFKNVVHVMKIKTKSNHRCFYKILTRKENKRWGNGVKE